MRPRPGSREEVVANVFINHTGADIGLAEQGCRWLARFRGLAGVGRMAVEVEGSPQLGRLYSLAR
jgi:hypothetical protein